MSSESTPPKYVEREGQTYSGFIRSNLATIERECEAGISQERIYEEIRQTTSFTSQPLDTFRTALKRARKRLKAQPNSQLAAPAASSPSPAPTPARQGATETNGVLMGRPKKTEFEYSAAQPGDNLEHILGTPKGKK